MNGKRKLRPPHHRHASLDEDMVGKPHKVEPVWIFQSLQILCCRQLMGRVSGRGGLPRDGVRILRPQICNYSGGSEERYTNYNHKYFLLEHIEFHQHQSCRYLLPATLVFAFGLQG